MPQRGKNTWCVWLSHEIFDVAAKVALKEMQRNRETNPQAYDYKVTEQEVVRRCLEDHLEEYLK